MIKVVDSVMGSGKTQGAIEIMNNDHENNYIYITPYLSEIKRIKQETNRTFYEPKVHQKDGKTVFKFESFHKLLSENKNIVSTHSLFSRANKETLELIHANDYILILDEVMDVVEQIELRKHDLESLIKLDFIRIDDETGLITWNEDKQHKETEYNYIKDLARNNSLYKYQNDIFVWTFPSHIFNSFKDVYVLTYLFTAQIQKYYYDLHGLSYEYYHATLNDFNQYQFVKGVSDDRKLKENLKQLINVYEGKLNKVGDDYHSLSKNWYKNRKEILKTLKNNTENYFKNIAKAKSSDIIWTTFKDFEQQVRGRGYTKSFVSSNLRATNEYSDRHNLAYTINKFLNPIIEKFFQTHDVKVDEEMFALSELIQWVWRSAIREDEEINLYLPSKRMREVLYKWLDDEI